MLAHVIVALLLLPPNQDPRLQGSFRESKNGWIYAHFQGAPRDIGYQYGYLLAAEIDDANKELHNFLSYSGKDWKWYRENSWKLFWPKVDGEYKQELLGMAEGLRARGYHYDTNDMLVQNSWIDLDWYYLPYLQSKEAHSKEQSKAPAQCSAFVATGSFTKDGRPVIAHSCWIDYVLGCRYNLILDIKPQKGNRILMDAWPGFIHSGDDFGINSAGIMITETTIMGFIGFDENGVPEFVRARKAMQYSNNLDDFARIMETGNNGGYANTWLIADTKTNEIGQLELGLKNVSFKRTMEGAYGGSNVPEDPNLIAQECDPKLHPVKFCEDRMTRWGQLLTQNKGKIDDELGKTFLADHYDIESKKDIAAANTLCGHMEEDPRPGFAAPSEDHYAVGSVQGKVATAQMAKHMSFWARSGHPCGTPFIVKDYVAKYPQWAKLGPYLKDMPTQPWTVFSAK